MGKRPTRIWRSGYALLILPVGFLGVFYFFPLFKITAQAFMPEGGFALQKLSRLVQSGYYFETFWFTCWQAALSTLLTLAVGVPCAFVFARYQFRAKALLQALATVPFVLPTVVVAAAFSALLGPRGLLNQWLMVALDLTHPPIELAQTIWLVLLAHVFYNFAVVLRIVGGFWAGLAPELTEAGRMLGAGPTKVFFKITWPLLRPAIITAGLLVFVFCFSSFGVILILGGPRYATIEVAIYRQAMQVFNLPMAAALSLLQILFTFALMWFYTRMQRRAAVDLDPVPSGRAAKPPAKGLERVFLALVIGFMLMFLGSPPAALILRSVTTAHGLSPAYYLALFQNPSGSVFFVPPFTAIGYSLGFALAALGMAMVLGVCAAVFLARSTSRLSALLDPVFMLPLSTSAVTLGFGFIIALDRPPLDLRTSIWLTPLAHTLVAFPFVVRSLLPVLRSIPPSLGQAAAVLGASPPRVWRHVDLPIMGRALLVAAVFAFSVSLGEFGATAFTARPDSPTMPVAIYRFLGQPGAANFGQAMAMSSLLMIVTAAGFLVLEHLHPGPSREF